MGWEADLTFIMGAPASADNVLALDLWAQSEGMPAWANNWLATTQDWPGAGIWNSAGVKTYPTLAAGLEATATTLSSPDYAVIVGYFQGDQGLANIYTAINASPWCRGCSNGNYPIALHDYLAGGGFISPSNPMPSSAPPATVDGTSTNTAWENYRAWITNGAGQQAVDLYLTQAAIDSLG